MEQSKTLKLSLLPSPGSSNVTFMEIKTQDQTFTAILSKADAIALQATGLFNLIFSNQTANTLHG